MQSLKLSNLWVFVRGIIADILKRLVKIIQRDGLTSNYPNSLVFSQIDLLLPAFAYSVTKFFVFFTDFCRQEEWIATEAVVHRCSSKKVLLKIWQYSQENIWAGYFLVEHLWWLLLTQRKKQFGLIFQSLMQCSFLLVQLARFSCG